MAPEDIDNVISPVISTSREAVGIRRCVAALQAHLMGPHRLELQEHFRIQLEAATRRGVELRHPSANAVRIKLLVPGAIERVRKVNAAAVAAQFYHLRAAVQRRIRPARMRLPPCDPAQPYRAG